MLKVENLIKDFPSIRAVDHLSFEVKEGEIFGLLGVNGAGKTTTFRMIINLLDQTDGSISYFGHEIGFNNSHEIGFLTEERSLLTKMKVSEQVMYYARLKGMKASEVEKQLDYWLERFNIVDYKNKKIKELSKGNQQKIQFITAIIHNPKLLILDEPFSGLDPINVELFMDVIKEFQSKGAIVIFSSHRMEHVELFCEKLIVLVEGKPVISGYIQDIKEQYRKKNIFVKADVNLDELKAIEGVVEVKSHSQEYEVKVENDQYINQVFDYVKNCQNVRRFDVKLPSLHEIFVERVGASYDG
jgi:ABC-2 type transport system ATP-binding protein